MRRNPSLSDRLSGFKPGHMECLVKIAIVALVAGIITPPIIRTKSYFRAKNEACLVYGDKKAPLTDAEKAEWFTSMGVPEGKKPYAKQTNQFHKDYKATYGK